MLDLSLLAPPAASSSTALKPSDLSLDVLAHSRRPAILTYASPIIDTASIISALPWYILGWKSEKDVLEVSMFESVVFARGWRNLPQSVKVVIEAEEKMQFYEMGIKIVAKFSGLRYLSIPNVLKSEEKALFLLIVLIRWILYHHRIFSFLFFTTAFWTSSIFSAGLAWLIFHNSFVPAVIKSEPSSDGKRIKSEPLSDSDPIDPFSTEDFSDTSRSFPTLGRQIPLYFNRADSAFKKEGARREEVEHQTPNTGIQPSAAIEADDEDDMDAGASWRDSGIGTSLDDGDRSGAYWRQRRRYTLDR